MKEGRKAEEKTKQKEGQEILKALKKQQTKQKEGRKAEEKTNRRKDRKY